MARHASRPATAAADEAAPSRRRAGRAAVTPPAAGAVPALETTEGILPDAADAPPRTTRRRADGGSGSAPGIDAAPSAPPVSATGSAIDPRSLLFDPDWYREAYPDVAAAGLDPIRHFFENGAQEGRQPNPFFDTRSYVETYADVAAARMNPFLHYLLYGAREGRRPR